MKQAISVPTKPKPAGITPDYAHIPSELRQETAWVNWQFEWTEVRHTFATFATISYFARIARVRTYTL
jgi:primase-polymerase (primpol)-like protein